MDHDVLVVGTGLTEAVLSAALSRAGLRVLHVDANAYYGGSWACLTLSEIAAWAAAHGAELAFPREPTVPRGAIPASCRAVDRHYSLALRPALLPANGPMIEALVRSNVASYATFRLLDCVCVYDGHLARVPSSKSEVFRHKGISLVDKRRLMRFLQLAMDADVPTERLTLAELLRDRMQLAPELQRAVQCGVALCWNADEPSDTALSRTRTSLRGLGRYGDAAFLVAQYGGAGELAQGFCRCSAVNGGTFVLGHRIERLAREGDRWALRIAGIDETFTAAQVAVRADELDKQGATAVADALPAAQQHALADKRPRTYEHLGIVVSDAPLRLDVQDERTPETALVVLPPGFAQESCAPNAIMVVMQGEGTFCCPKGQYVYYLVTYSDTPARAADLLRPAVRTLQEQQHDTPALPILECFYTRVAGPAAAYASDGDALATASHSAYVDTSAPPLRTSAARSSLCLDERAARTQRVPNLTESLDLCVEQAEQAFWALVGTDKRQDALRAAEARQRQHDPREYEGRGGAEPDYDRLAAPADIEFFPPQPAAEMY